MTLETTTLIVIFMSAHVCFMFVLLYYVRKRFVRAYGRIFEIETKLNGFLNTYYYGDIKEALRDIDKQEAKIKVDREGNVVYIRHSDGDERDVPKPDRSFFLRGKKNED